MSCLRIPWRSTVVSTPYRSRQSPPADADVGTLLTYSEQMCMIPPSDGSTGRERGWRALLDALGGYLAEDTRRAQREAAV